MKKITLCVSIALLFLLVACKNSDEQPQSTLDFDFVITGDCSTAVLEVVFVNKSTNVNSFVWNFGDGTTSTEKDPKKIYAKAGIYNVSLMGSSSGKSLEKEISIARNSDGTEPSIELSFTRVSLANLNVQFKITTDLTAYTLNFGDGTKVEFTDGTKIVNHTYSGFGDYRATVYLTNSQGTSCAQATISLAP